MPYRVSFCDLPKWPVTAAALAALLVASCEFGQSSVTRSEVRIAGPGDKVTNGLARPLSVSRAAPRGFEPTNTGDPVKAADYPWQVGVEFLVNGQWWGCGGILVSPQYVLTAAHCVDIVDGTRPEKIIASSFKIYHGHDRWKGGQTYLPDPDWTPVLHPLWKANLNKPYLYDAAIIKLAQPVGGATTAPVQIAGVVARRAIVSGWGRDRSNAYSDVLRAVEVATTDNATCSNDLPSPYGDWVGTATLCTKTPRDDACTGDSGGPLAIGSRSRPQTIGIVSWGPPTDCGVSTRPGGPLIGAYTRASAIAGWVRDTTGDQASVTSATPEPLMALNSLPATAQGQDQ